MDSKIVVYYSQSTDFSYPSIWKIQVENNSSGVVFHNIDDCYFIFTSKDKTFNSGEKKETSIPYLYKIMPGEKISYFLEKPEKWFVQFIVGDPFISARDLFVIPPGKYNVTIGFSLGKFLPDGKWTSKPFEIKCYYEVDEPKIKSELADYTELLKNIRTEYGKLRNNTIALDSYKKLSNTNESILDLIDKYSQMHPEHQSIKRLALFVSTLYFEDPNNSKIKIMNLLNKSGIKADSFYNGFINSIESSKEGFLHFDNYFILENGILKYK